MGVEGKFVRGQRGVRRFHTANCSASHSRQRYTTCIDWIDSCVPRDLSTIERRAPRTSSDPQVGQRGVRSRSHTSPQAPHVTVMVSLPGPPRRSPDRSSSSPQPGHSITLTGSNRSHARRVAGCRPLPHVRRATARPCRTDPCCIPCPGPLPPSGPGHRPGRASHGGRQRCLARAGRSDPSNGARPHPAATAVTAGAGARVPL